MQLKPINQQVVVVVGAHSNIGRETALAFAARGAKVAVAARNRAGLSLLVEEITSSGGEAISIPADVADYGQVCAIAQGADNAFGRIDTWVHHATVNTLSPFDEVSIEEFRRVIDVTLMSQVYGAKVAIPHLQRTGSGSLISIFPMESCRALPLQSAYSTAKHGLEGFIESLRAELEGTEAINLASINPATINPAWYESGVDVNAVDIPPRYDCYDSKLVANAILHAAEYPTRDCMVDMWADSSTLPNASLPNNHLTNPLKS